jgi:hypothetical protein
MLQDKQALAHRLLNGVAESGACKRRQIEQCYSADGNNNISTTSKLQKWANKIRTDCLLRHHVE